jgi:hypothetical protein
MPINRYPGQGGGLLDPSERFEVIVPDNDEDLEVLPKFICIGDTGGALAVHDADGNAVTFDVIAGQVLPIRPYRVLETTVATVIACY